LGAAIFYSAPDGRYPR